MNLLIKITKQVLETSSRCHYSISSNCAIAVAIRELLPDAIVGLNAIIPFGVATGDLIPLPDMAKDFIMDFDSKQPEERRRMQPIEFEIDIPDSVIDQLQISEVTTLIEESLTLELA